MEQFYAMVNVQATLFIYMAVGYLARKTNLITKELRSGISDLLVYVLLPCMVFNSLNQDMTVEELRTGAVILAMAFFLSFLAWVAGLVCWRRYPPEKQNILRYGTLVANSGFAGLPVIQGVYGQEGLFLASIFIIANRVLMWSAGVSLFGKGNKSDMVKKVLLNPGIIAVFLGLAWMLLDLPLPAFCASAIASMGNATSPISLIVVGAALAEVDWRGVFERDVFLASAVRLILLPVMAIVIMRALHFDRLSTGVAVILTGMPIGSTTVILGQKYGADALFASKTVFVSTLFSLITIPILTLFL